VASEGFGVHSGQVGTEGFPYAVHQLTGEPDSFFSLTLRSEEFLEVQQCVPSDEMLQWIVDIGGAADVTRAAQLIADEPVFDDGVNPRPDIGYCSPIISSSEAQVIHPAGGVQSLVVTLSEESAEREPLTEPVSYELELRDLEYSCEDAQAGVEPPSELVPDPTSPDVTEDGTPAQHVYSDWCVRS
jgi:hypothetical protein